MERHSTARTFVPPAPTTIQEMNVFENKRAVTHRQVTASWLENAGAGLGAAALLISGWIAVHGAGHAIGWIVPPWPDWLQVGIGAGVTALAVWGALTFSRSAIDELVTSGDWHRMQQDLDAASAIIETLKAELKAERKRASVAELQRDTLTARMTQRRDIQRVAVTPQPELGPAWADARHLIERRWRGLKWGKDALTGRDGAGWTPTRWMEAMELLKRSGVAVRGGVGGAYVPWDENADVQVALATFAAYQERTQELAGNRFASFSDETNPEVTIDSE